MKIRYIHSGVDPDPDGPAFIWVRGSGFGGMK